MRVSSLAAWLLPDVACAAAMVALFYSVVLFPGYRKFFADSDAGWHIRAGEQMLANRALPKVEPFSFSLRGTPWFAWEWGADVMVGTIHRKWGLSGVVFFYACIISAGVWLWFQLNWMVGGNFLLACVFAAPMISSTTMHWLARPHLISWLFLLGTVIFAEKLRRDPRLTPARIAGVVAASCLWANIHGSFFLGAGIAFIYALGIAVGTLLWEANEKQRWQPFIAVGLISAAATLINPYGWALHSHVFSYLTDGALLSLIGEFQSFNFHMSGAGQVMVVLAIAICGAVLALVQKDLPVVLLAALLIGAAIRSARGWPIVAILLLPLANGAITKSLAAWPGLRMPVRRGITGFLDYCDRLRTFDARVHGFAWLPIAALLCIAFLHSPAIAAETGFPTDEYPVAAAKYVESLPLDARILSTDKFGGYLIYRFNGQRKVFFDGRSDLYGAEFVKQCARLMQGRPGWQGIIEPYHFDSALLPSDYPLIPALESAGWKPVYHDSVCTLLMRN